MDISHFTSQIIGDKRRWRDYKVRTKVLPEAYRTAVEGIERYLMYFGAADSDNATSIFEDVADIFERAAADGTPIRDIVGDNPVEFINSFVANYEKGGYIAREQQRLFESITRAEAQEAETL